MAESEGIRGPGMVKKWSRWYITKQVSQEHMTEDEGLHPVMKYALHDWMRSLLVI